VEFHKEKTCILIIGFLVSKINFKAQQQYNPMQEEQDFATP
jgi:hypothetical protein